MRSRLNRQGSNQYRNKRRSSWKIYTFGYIIVVLLFILTAQYYKNEGAAKVYAEEVYTAENIISPLADEPKVKEATDKQSISIRNKIREVFGDHADKAFKVLSCENAALNPNAVNTAGNEPAGSRDIGVFQINEYWQKTQGKFLFDPEVNIKIAYIIFKDNGYSFDRWTCGRKFGI